MKTFQNMFFGGHTQFRVHKKIFFFQKKLKICDFFQKNIKNHDFLRKTVIFEKTMKTEFFVI